MGCIEVEDVEEFNEEYTNDPERREREERVAESSVSGVDAEEESMPLVDRASSFETDEE